MRMLARMDRPPADAPPPTPRASLPEIKRAGERWGLEPFVTVVNSLVERYLPAKRGFNVKLRAAFNPRLVRYYATFGLISPPEREGKEARYTYLHLLQALVIRRLLFEGFTAPALLKMLAGKTETDYEAMLAAGVTTVAASPISRAEVDEPVEADESTEDPRLVRGLTDAPPPLPPAPVGPPAAAPLWRRVEVAPGLELHVRADFLPPDTRARRESLLLAVLAALS